MSGSGIRLPIEAGNLPVGTQNIFIGVNLTEEQAKHFAAKSDNVAYTIPKAYQDLIYGLSEVYAPGGGIGLKTNYPGNYTRKDIAMFCTEGQSLVFDKKTLEYTCHFPFVLKRNVATSVFGFDGKPTSISTWIIYGVIFLYYLIATVFPIDAIIGRIYPIFGAILLFSAVGVFIGMFVKGYPLLNVWDDWSSPILQLTGADGAVKSFTYADYFKGGP